MKTHALWFLLAAVTMIAACDKDDDPTAKNQLPVVAMISPLNWVNYNLYDTLQFVAEASDPDGKIENVLFYFDQILVGTDSTMPYQCEKIMTETGTHIIFAKATDNMGASAFTDSTYIYSQDPNAPGVNLTISPFSYLYKEFDNLQFNLTVVSPVGEIVSSALYINNHLYGIDSTSPFSFTWDSIPAGTYLIYGIAEDDKGRIGTSAVTYLSINPNEPPTVQINLTGGQNFEYLPGEFVKIDVSVNDPDGPIDYVELFANDQLLDTLRNYFVYWWENAPSGEYDLIAKAYDTKGGVGISEPKHIKVLPGIVYNDVIDELTYSENDDLVFGLNQSKNKLLLINPINPYHTEITLPFAQPIAMDYSVQDQKLYIIYKFTGSISVFDHSTQSLSELEFSAVDDGRDICVDALNRRIYLLSTAGLYILDMQSGDVLLNATAIEGASMVIEPDNQWLFTASSISSSETLYKYSVEGDVLNLIQTRSGIGSSAKKIKIHPEGDYVVIPCIGGNGRNQSVFAYSTADLDNILGEFNMGFAPIFAAFSPDGNYMLGGSGFNNEIYVMNARSFLKENQIHVPNAREYVRMTTNNTADKIIVFTYYLNYEREHVLFFFDL